MRQDFDRREEQNKREIAVMYKQFAILTRSLDRCKTRLESLEEEEAILNQSRQDWDTQNAVDDAARMQAEKEAAEAREAAEKRQPKRRKGK